MGDLIQTIGLVNSASKLSSDVQIDILVMKAFAPIVKHFEHINEIYMFDDSVLNEGLDDDIWGACSSLYETINTLNKKAYDVLFNPIVSKQSSLLAFLINAKQKLGLQMTINREQKMTCDFTAYLLANQHSLGDFSFNLVDIFAGMVKDVECNHKRELFLPEYEEFRLVNIHPNLSKLDVASRVPTGAGHGDMSPTGGGSLFVIGFHIGASQSNKAWNMGYYKVVMQELLKTEEFKIVLFGGYKEKEFKSFFSDIKDDKFYNAIGDFNLEELISAISSVDLFVTNDTGPMHIASARGVPVIDISLGPVSKWETGAYNENALIIESKLDCHPCSFTYECPHWNCHHDITPEVVIEAIKFKVRGTRIEARDKVRFYTCKKDEFGFHTFIPLFKDEVTKIEYIFLAKRYIWSMFMVGELNKHVTEQTPLIASQHKTNFFDTVKSSYILSHLSFDDLKNHIIQLIKHNSKIIEILNIVLEDKKSIDKNKHILLSVSSEKELLFNKAKEFELIYDWFWFVLFKESEIDDDDLCLICEKTANLYSILKMKLEIFNELINNL